MPKIARELAPIEVRRITRPGFHSVGGVPGLKLQVTEGGGRSWVLRVMVGSKRRGFGLGSYPSVSLAAAREKATELRAKLAEGFDPVADRREKRDAIQARYAARLTFAEAARKCYAAKADEFRNAKHRQQWLASLELHVFPSIGEVPVGDIELAHIVSVLEPIWREKTETASRVRQRIEAALTWATVSGFRKGDNPARWSGNLDAIFPNAAKVKKSSHWPALPWMTVPEFMADLRTREGMAAKALQFAILTASRSGEVRGASWSEIDTATRLWTIPGDRMKARKPHRVPLSAAAMSLLESLPRAAGEDLIFPAPRGGCLSDMTIAAVVRRMNQPEVRYTDGVTGAPIVPHGFRSSFKDWCRNRSGVPDEVSELALAHVNSDATRAAYARDELLPQRSKLMAEWAAFCSRPPKSPGKVTRIREAG